MCLVASTTLSPTFSSLFLLYTLQFPIPSQTFKKMGFYSTITNQISFYTGLSPTAFFTIAFLTFLVYRTVSAMFVSPQDFNKPPVVSARSGSLFEVAEPRREPVQVGEITEAELRLYNGSDKSKPILISVKGQIYDVSEGR